MNQLVKVTLATDLLWAQWLAQRIAWHQTQLFIAHGSENIDYRKWLYYWRKWLYIGAIIYWSRKNNNFVINGYNITGNEQESSMIDIWSNHCKDRASSFNGRFWSEEGCSIEGSFNWAIWSTC